MKQEPANIYSKLIDERQHFVQTHQPPLRGQAGYQPYQPTQRRFSPTPKSEQVIRSNAKYWIAAGIFLYWLTFVIGTFFLMYHPGQTDGSFGSAIFIALIGGSIYGSACALILALAIFPIMLFFSGTTFGQPNRVTFGDDKVAYRNRQYGWMNEEDAY